MKFIDKVKEIVKERKFKYIYFFWIIISIQFVIGHNLQINGYSIKDFKDFLASLLKIIVLSIIFIVLHYFIIKLIEKYKNRKIVKIRKTGKVINITKHKLGIYFVIIIICWMPIFLAFCPIITNYDGLFQIRDFINLRSTTRHPVLHTFLLTMFYVFGVDYLNSATYGMLLFTILQMSIMALIFSYTVKFIEDKTEKKWLRNISLLFYAIFPFNQLFPLMTTKDVLFAGIVLLFIISVYKIIEEKHKKTDYIYMIIISVLMLSFRNNAIYAIIISIPFIIAIMFKDKEKLRRILISCAVIIITYQIFNNVLIFLTNTGKDTSQEKMSVFSQATAKICKEKNNLITEDEKEKISYYFGDYKLLREVYNSSISDKTKEMVECEIIDNNKGDFLKFMIHLVIKYPRQFIDSFLNTTRGYWYICDESFNKVSVENNPNTKGILELTDDELGTGKYKVESYSFFPKVKEFYKNLFCRNDYMKIPVIYIIFQPATYFYIILAYLLYSIYKKDKTKSIIGIYLFSYFITCFLGPVALIRYIYSIIVSIPVLFGITLSKK